MRSSHIATFPDPALVRPSCFAKRRADLFSAISGACGSDSVLIRDPKDILYLTGVREGVFWLILSAETPILIARQMMFHEILETAIGCEVVIPCSGSTAGLDVEKFAVSLLVKHDLQRVVIDTAKISAATYFSLSRHAGEAGLHLEASVGLTSRQRSIKDADETALIAKCVEIAVLAFRELISDGSVGLVGRSERELAFELERLMVAGGADRQGFPESGIIVASGPNSASAHHVPSDRRVVRGEPLLIDWGAELGGYRSDMTRTLFPGSLPPFAATAYHAVEKALNDAAAELRPGMSMGEIDRISRVPIADAGFPDFHYGVGHGVGLDIHEGPWLRPGSEEVLEESMITTLEPGVYLPGVGGIRIENLYRILPGGVEVLGDLPTDLASMILE